MTPSYWIKVGLVCASFFIATVGNVWSQADAVSKKELVINNPSVKLIDQFGIITGEDRSARLDLLLQELNATPGSVGYIYLYCGKKCRYGEIEAHQRGIEIKLALRKFDRNRIVVLNAGFRESFETELWVGLNDHLPPRMRSTVNIRFVEFSGKVPRTFEAYDCCDDFSDFWKNIKP